MVRDKKKLFEVILCVTIGLIVLTGCGNTTKEVRSNVDKINKAIEALLDKENFKLTRDSALTIGDITSKSVNEITFNNNTKDGYVASFLVADGEPDLYSETLVVDGTCYLKGEFVSEWLNSGKRTMETLVGLQDLLSINISPEDCKEIKTSTEGDKEVISMVASSSYLKKFKDKTIEQLLNSSEEDSNPTEEVKQEFNNLLDKASFKNINYTFAIDKSGVLIGLKADYVLEMPNMNTNEAGEIKVGNGVYNITSASDITVDSYNDSSNAKIIEDFKSELNK